MKYTIEFSEEHYYRVVVEADSVDKAVEKFYAEIYSDFDSWTETKDSELTVFHIGIESDKEEN